jgi:hypothetical protein
MSEFEINDVRTEKEFKSISFSGFKKSDVTKELLNSLLNNKVEPACYWSAELVCAGHYIDLWNVLINFIGKYIHLANPKLAIYLDKRIQDFKSLMEGGYVGQELRLRNNDKMRELFSEVTAILCLSSRKPCLEKIHKLKGEEFEITKMTERFRAPDASYAEHIFRREDPRELFPAVNELSFNIHSKDIMRCYYWIEWILEYEKLCKSKKMKCKVDRREQIPVNEKDQMDVVWLIWDLILHYVKKNNQIYQTLINSLLSIFCLRYTNGIVSKRKFIIFYSISVLTEIVNFKIPAIIDKKVVTQVKGKINLIYKEIKKSEVAPATDYLFNNNVSKTNIDKTIEKLDIMKQF